MNKISSKHLLFLISGVTIVSMKTYPNVLTKDGGRDTWIAVLIASLIICGYSIYMMSIFKKNNNYTMHKIYCISLGEIGGKIFILLFILMLFITLVESSSALSNAMHTNMLLETPSWFFLIFVVLVSIYVVGKGDTAVLTVVMIGIVFISLAGINLFVLSMKYKKIKYIFPIFGNGITKEFIFSTLKSLGLYGSFAIVLPYISKVNDKKNIRKYTIISIIYVVQMEIVAMIGTLTTFGILRTNEIIYPKLIQTQLISYFRFLELGELYVMMQMVGGWVVKYVLTLYSILLLLKDIKMYSKYNIYIISALSFISSFFISRNLVILFKYFNYYTYTSLIGFIIIPFLIFSISLFRKHDKNLQKNIE